jgi:hypothetical protein
MKILLAEKLQGPSSYSRRNTASRAHAHTRRITIHVFFCTTLCPHGEVHRERGERDKQQHQQQGSSQYVNKKYVLYSTIHYRNKPAHYYSLHIIPERRESNAPD